jgi:hypothetical protein
MAITLARDLTIRSLDTGRYYDTLIANASTVYRHCFVGISATGFLVNQADSAAIQPGGLLTKCFGGPSGGDDAWLGDGTTVWGRYYTDIEVFVPTANHAVAVVATMVRNTQLYALDNGDVTNVNTGGASIGVMTEFTATGIWVLIGGVVRPNAV